VIPAGTVIDGRYQIIGPLAAGGMGEVYRATRRLLGDEVALKVMNASFDEASTERDRFLRESRTCARLRHPNIVSILDFNVDPAGQPYLVMELLSGPSLREELKVSGPMSPANIVAVLTPLAGALQLAHEHGITHRDLKPANVVAHRYDSGERIYKIIDFGLAAIKEAPDATRLTNPNMFLGTLAYAAPEQLRGQPADARTDIYSFGVIAYEMLTGHLPRMAGRGPTIGDEPTGQTARPAAGHDQPSEAFDAAISRALADDPAARWSSVADFMRALQGAAGSLPGATPATTDDGLLSRYELGELIGRGRFGSTVYRAVHRALGVPVAIRVLRREEQPHWDAVKTRFLLEARTLQVAHPNLLQVRDYGEDDRLLFVVTDHIEGNSLRQELAATGQLEWSRALSLFHQMVSAAAALNTRGGYLVGVNPDMIRLTNDGSRERIVLSTAGIRSLQDVLHTMREQELRGEEANEKELPYIAPEVLMGRAPEPAADVFTLAVLFYQMVTGVLPFRAATLPELIGQMLQTVPVDARSLNPQVAAATSALLSQCLVFESTLRIPSARVLLERL
jgi:serine/threonine protein kinase